jgi:hypothetical protein
MSTSLGKPLTANLVAKIISQASGIMQESGLSLLHQAVEQGSLTMLLLQTSKSSRQASIGRLQKETNKVNWRFDALHGEKDTS